MKRTICLILTINNNSENILNTLINLTTYINFDYWIINALELSDNVKEIIINYFR
jgi:hypothetical protein